MVMLPKATASTVNRAMAGSAPFPFSIAGIRGISRGGNRKNTVYGTFLMVYEVTSPYPWPKEPYRYKPINRKDGRLYIHNPLHARFFKPRMAKKNPVKASR